MACHYVPAAALKGGLWRSNGIQNGSRASAWNPVARTGAVRMDGMAHIVHPRCATWHGTNETSEDAEREHREQVEWKWIGASGCRMRILIARALGARYGRLVAQGLLWTGHGAGFLERGCRLDRCTFTVLQCSPAVGRVNYARDMRGGRSVREGRNT